MTSTRRRNIEKIAFEGPAGTLEGALMVPPADVRGLCVVCHPHPLYGGTMDNKVVYTLAAAAVAQGFAALRFNFRGVRGSAGRHDAGQGEVEDTLEAVAWLQAYSGARPLLLAGFSFGAQMALRAAQTTQPCGLITVGTPATGRLDAEDPPSPACPWLAIHGRDDDVVDYAQTLSWLQTTHPHARLETIAGTGHFFHGHLGELRARVEPFIASLG